MKPFILKSINGTMVMAMLMFSCNTATQPVIQKDSVKTDTAVIAPATGGNFVKSEAPDAVSKMEQGYAMPKYNDKLLQSPVNISDRQRHQGQRSRNTDKIQQLCYSS